MIAYWLTVYGIYVYTGIMLIGLALGGLVTHLIKLRLATISCYYCILQPLKLVQDHQEPSKAGPGLPWGSPGVIAGLQQLH